MVRDIVQLSVTPHVSMETAYHQMCVLAILDGLAMYAVKVFSNYASNDAHVSLLLTFSDINECDNVNVGCMHSCNNTNGSYHCTCNSGYVLAADGHMCNGECVSTNLIESITLYNPGYRH